MGEVTHAPLSPMASPSHSLVSKKQQRFWGLAVQKEFDLRNHWMPQYPLFLKYKTIQQRLILQRVPRACSSHAEHGVSSRRWPQRTSHLNN